ncbi:MAG TPA: hypothetical protein VE078_09545, partial [Thermoanaerobaculia bacterium]|nr:hypothetical protein [Thermoanaerobaculia bacterium]
MRYACLRLIVHALLLALGLILFAGCRRSAPEGEVWFVQATDPHLFHDGKTEERLTKRVSEHQEKLNQEAFSRLIATLNDLPGTGEEPAFLVVSGDFGIDRFTKELQAALAPAAAPPPQPPAEGAASAGTPAPQTTPTPAPGETSTPASSPQASPSPSSGLASTPAPTSDASGEVASASVDSAVNHLVEVLSKSPVKDIYLVPGNNDVGDEA